MRSQFESPIAARKTLTNQWSRGRHNCVTEVARLRWPPAATSAPPPCARFARSGAVVSSPAHFPVSVPIGSHSGALHATESSAPDPSTWGRFGLQVSTQHRVGARLREPNRMARLKLKSLAHPGRLTDTRGLPRLSRVSLLVETLRLRVGPRAGPPGREHSRQGLRLWSGPQPFGQQ
jgi:hypothetical protein